MPVTSTPVSTPMAPSVCARSSRARSPLAPGANGQPPRPPTLPSTRATPASIARNALGERETVGVVQVDADLGTPSAAIRTSRRDRSRWVRPCRWCRPGPAPTRRRRPRRRRPRPPQRDHRAGERQPNAVARASSTGRPARGEPGDLAKAGQPVSDGLAGVLALMRFGHRDHPLQMAQTRGQGPWRAPFVQHESPARDGVGVTSGGGHHLLGVGHRRHSIRPNSNEVSSRSRMPAEKWSASNSSSFAAVRTRVRQVLRIYAPPGGDARHGICGLEGFTTLVRE